MDFHLMAHRRSNSNGLYAETNCFEYLEGDIKERLKDSAR